MSLIRGKDTEPERIVRKLLTSMGCRYRLQYKKLAGRPDIAMPGRRIAIWVHGCFWHQHRGCRLARMPKSREEFWRLKLESNRTRDERREFEARELGWSTLVIWECELSDQRLVQARLEALVSAKNPANPATRAGRSPLLSPSSGDVSSTNRVR